MLAAAGATSIGTRAGGLLAVDFDQADFQAFSSGGAREYLIDNPYWPLRPDTTPRIFTYISVADDECVVDLLTVSGKTYELDGEAPYSGFVAVEVEDVEYVFDEVDEEDCYLGSEAVDLEDNEAVMEATRDWYAQDDRGNIWYLGEISRVYGEDDCEIYGGTPPFPGDYEPDDECFEGSWEAGKNHAPENKEEIIGEAGIVAPSDMPIEGEPLKPGNYYMQEVAYEAEDMAKVLKMKASVSVDDGEFATAEYVNCRKVKEWTALDPGASVEHKWYCPGPGLLLIEGIGGGPSEAETLVDVSPGLP